MSNRFDYVKYDQESERLQSNAKALMVDAVKMINQIPDGRAKSLALTKLEEAYMWIGKAIRDEQIQRNGSAELQEERCDS